MRERGGKRREIIFEGAFGLGNGGQRDLLAVVVHVVAEDKGMVALFLRLDHVVVGVALKTGLLVIIGKRKVQVSAVEFCVYLLVYQLCDFRVHDASFPGPHGRRSKPFIARIISRTHEGGGFPR